MVSSASGRVGLGGIIHGISMEMKSFHSTDWYLFVASSVYLVLSHLSVHKMERQCVSILISSRIYEPGYHKHQSEANFWAGMNSYPNLSVPIFPHYGWSWHCMKSSRDSRKRYDCSNKMILNILTHHPMHSSMGMHEASYYDASIYKGVLEWEERKMKNDVFNLSFLRLWINEQTAKYWSESKLCWIDAVKSNVWMENQTKKKLYIPKTFKSWIMQFIFNRNKTQFIQYSCLTNNPQGPNKLITSIIRATRNAERM